MIGHLSVYEVNQLIKDRQEPQLLLDLEEESRLLVEEKLPLLGYSGATLAYFLKKNSDILPPHRFNVDYDIQLIADNSLTSSLLYSMSLKQLELVKAYLDNYLKRRFIIHSNVAYASPVLFAKKPGGGWRFCMDYQKLNTIAKKMSI